MSVPVVILAGGRGARFDHESQVTPKPMIEVAGKPILGHIMDLCEAQGFDEFWILGGYKCEVIEEYLSTRYECTDTPHGYEHIRVFGGRGERVKTHLFFTGEDATTGDRLMTVAMEFKLSRPVILTYGDGLADVDLNALLVHHDRMRVGKKLPTVTLTAVQPPGRFGVLQFDVRGDEAVQTDDVVGFEEKSRRDWINGGFMVVDPGAVMMFVPQKPGDWESGVFESFETGALPRLANHGLLNAYRHRGYWRCMDTRRDLEQIEQDVRDAGGGLPWIRGK